MVPLRQTELIVDPAVIADLKSFDEDGEPSIFTALVKLFFENTPKILESMRQAIRVRDLKTVSRQAHTLSSNCGNLGIFPMALMCRDLEGMTDPDELFLVSATVRDLELEYLRAMVVLMEIPPFGVSEAHL